MSPVLLYAIVAISAVAFRFCLGLTEGCLYIGRTLDDSGSKTGFQTAVAPPYSAGPMLFVYASVPVLVGYAFWEFGILTGVAVLVEFIAIALIAGATFIPKRDSPFWVRLVYRSLVRRVADYARKNDHLRAQAASVLVDRIHERLAEKLLGHRNSIPMPDRALEAASKLGELMEQYPLAILDTRELPLPKPEMKLALKTAWRLAPNERMRSAAEAAYLHLSNFQDGVGDKPIDGTLPGGTDPKADLKILNAWLPWAEKAEKEMAALLAELNEFKRQVACCRFG